MRRWQGGFVSIGQVPSGASSLARDRAADASLMIALLVSAAMAGGGIYEVFVFFPAWAAMPPMSFSLLSSAAGGALPISAAMGRFWLAFYWAAGAALMVALVLNWSWGWRRTMVLVALGCFTAMRVWTYLVLSPELAAMLSTPTSAAVSADLINRVAQWTALNRSREIIDCLLVVCLALAFRVPSRPAPPAGVPAGGAYRRAQK